MFKLLKTRGLFILRFDCLFPWHGWCSHVLQVISKDRYPLVVTDHPLSRGFDPARFSRPAGNAGMISRGPGGWKTVEKRVEMV